MMILVGGPFSWRVSALIRAREKDQLKATTNSPVLPS